MENQVFVGRDRELARLDAHLQAALGGHGQVCFVAGEPGGGKTALLREFARRAQAKHADLLVAAGDCNAQTGVGEPYLPFREVLALLTGDLEAKLAQGVITEEGASRLQKLLARSALVLLETGPDLIGAFVPGGKIMATVGKAAAKQAGLEAKLTAAAQRKPSTLALTQAAVDRENIFEQYSNFLLKMSSHQPVLIMLDDLHWGDASSVSLLFHLARRIEKGRILIVGAYRPADMALGRRAPGADPERHPLEQALSELKRYLGDIILELETRDAAEARRFVDLLVDAEPNVLPTAFRESLVERTGGNPLFVVELIRDLRERGDLRRDAAGMWVASPAFDWEMLPVRIEGVIEERIARLERELRRTLTIASVEGEEFIAEVVARLLELGERETVRRLSEELAKQHRLVDQAGVARLAATRISRYRFHHRLLRRYLYDRLDPAERAYLHEDVAKVLETLYAGQTDDVAFQLAWHYAEAGLDEKAAGYYRRAGELAAARFANDEAVAHLARALSLTPERDARARFDLLLAREAIYARQGRRAEQEQDLATLAALAIGLKDAGAQARVSLLRADHARLTADYATALKHAQAAVAQAEVAGDKRIEAEGYAVWGLVLRHQGSFAEAGEWLDLALDLAQSLDDPGLIAQITYWAGLNQYSWDRFDLALGNIARASEIFERLADDMGQTNCLLLLGTIQARRGNYGSAITYLGQALETCRKIGWRSREAIILSDLGNTLVEAGDYEAAQRYHRQMTEIAAEIGDHESEAASLDTLGVIHQHLGRNAEALPFFDKALLIQRGIGYRRGEAYTLTHQGLALSALGELERAAKALSDALTIRYQLADNIGASVDDVAGLARIALAQGRTEQAKTYVDEALAWMAANGTDSVEYPVQVYLTCYQVLRDAAGREAIAAARAVEVLKEGRTLLQKRAASIQDPARRQMYLANVPFNRELLEI